MREKAIAFARKAHDGQLRKGTDRPYIVHPLEVLGILETLTEDEELLSAGVLHDTIEDCAQVTQEMLEEEFGVRVAQIVAGESEDKTKTWVERKSHTIQTLPTSPREVQMIALADKLSNIRDIVRDYPQVGDQLWQRFRMKDKDIIGWYYRGVLFALEDSMGKTDAYREYKKHVIAVFGERTKEQNTIQKITEDREETGRKHVI